MLIEYTVAVLSCLITAIVIRRAGAWSLPTLACLVFTVGFSLRIVLLRRTGENRVFNAYHVIEREYDEIAAYGFFCFTAMCVGIVLALSFLRKLDAVRLNEPQPPTRKQYRVQSLMAMYVVGLVAQIVLLGRTYGGVGQAFEQLSQRVFSGESNFLATNMTFFLIPLILFALIEARRTDRTRFYKFGLVILALSLLWFAVLNGRAIVIVTVWTFALTHFLAFRERTRAKSIIGIGIVVLVTSVMGLAWRASSQRGTPLAREVERYSGDSFFIVSDSLPIFDHLRMGMQYADMRGNDGGLSLLEAFTVLIPRSIWPEKPIFVPQLIGEATVFSRLSGLPAGLLGEGYIGANWFGAALFALGFGIALGIAHRLTRLSRVPSPVATGVIFMFVNATLVALRTGAQGALITLQISLIFLVVLFLIGKLAEGRTEALKAARSPMRSDRLPVVK